MKKGGTPWPACFFPADDRRIRSPARPLALTRSPLSLQEGQFSARSSATLSTIVFMIMGTPRTRDSRRHSSMGAIRYTRIFRLAYPVGRVSVRASCKPRRALLPGCVHLVASVKTGRTTEQNWNTVF